LILNRYLEKIEARMEEKCTSLDIFDSLQTYIEAELKIRFYRFTNGKMYRQFLSDVKIAKTLMEVEMV
jgi:hypothetical protein